MQQLEISVHTQYIIVGQGLAGSWLSWYLREAGASFVVIDDARRSSPSRIASGIINPVTGRRFVTTWMIQELMAHACQSYAAAGEAMGRPLIRECPVYEFFSTAQMRDAFAKRTASATDGFTSLGTEEAAWQPYVNAELGYGIINPAYQVEVNGFLNGMRRLLQEAGQLREEVFDAAALETGASGVTYKDIKAEKIIFCDGAGSFQHPLFRLLPFAFTKGEMLTVAIEGLPATGIYKKGMSVVPYDNGQFWVGSTYEWSFDNDQPTAVFRQRTEEWLRHFIKAPFTVTGHFAALRPATVERRPFVGLHPRQPSVGIFNGLGTKGVSLAPFFARQLAGSLLNGTGIAPEADVNRFQKILSRQGQ